MHTTRVLASALSFVLTASPVAAQTVARSAPVPRPVLTTTAPAAMPTVATPPTGTPSPALGAYDRLSPGNRKIARALRRPGRARACAQDGHGNRPRPDDRHGHHAGQQEPDARPDRGNEAARPGLGPSLQDDAVARARDREEPRSGREPAQQGNAVGDDDGAHKGKHDRSGVSGGHGHGRNTGTTVSARGSGVGNSGGHGVGNGGGHGGSNGGGNAGGHGKSK